MACGLPIKFGLSDEYLGGKLVNMQATYVPIDADRQTDRQMVRRGTALNLLLGGRHKITLAPKENWQQNKNE